MKILRTYGDSHSSSEHGGWGKIKINGLTIETNWLGPKLMYSFGRDKQQIVKNIAPTDILCFCFGEIDCRLHIIKYKPWKDTIVSVVKSYFDAIKKNIGGHDPSLVCVYNVIPPQERNEEVHMKTDIVPISNKERKDITCHMNEKIKELCDENGFVFFDTYNDYSNDNGFIIPELTDGTCHISNPIHNINFLKKMLNQNKYE